jgi:hypothetical protein
MAPASAGDAFVDAMATGLVVAAALSAAAVIVARVLLLRRAEPSPESAA